MVQRQYIKFKAPGHDEPTQPVPCVRLRLVYLQSANESAVVPSFCHPPRLCHSGSLKMPTCLFKWTNSTVWVFHGRHARSDKVRVYYDDTRGIPNRKRITVVVSLRPIHWICPHSGQHTDKSFLLVRYPEKHRNKARGMHTGQTNQHNQRE